MTPTAPHDEQQTPRESTSPVELAAALRSVGDESRSTAWHRSFAVLAQRIEGGVPLDDAIQSARPRLPRGTGKLLLAAMRGGQTGAALAGLGQHNRRRGARRDELVAIFAYPALLLLLTAVVGILVTLYVRPELTAIVQNDTYRVLDDFGVQSPTLRPSKTLLLDAEWLHNRQPWPMVIAFGGLFGIGGLALVSRNVAPAIFDRLVGWIPIVGGLLRQAAQEEWCRLAGLLVTVGRPLDEAADTATAMLPPGDVANAMRGVGRRLRRGESLRSSLAVQPTFPATATAVVAWGETSGAVADTLAAAGDLLADQVRARMEIVKNVVGPVIVVVVAALAISFLVLLLESLLIFLPLIGLIESLS